MRFQRKQATVEAAQVGQDFALADGTLVSAGEWLVRHDDGSYSKVADGEFQEEWAPAADIPVEAPQPEQPASDSASNVDAPGPDAPTNPGV